jgi:hypothetical protein
MWAAIVVAVVIAAAGAWWGAQGARQASRSHARIAALEAQLASLQQRVTADERAAAGARREMRGIAARASGAQRSLQRVNWALQSAPSEAQLAAVRNEIGASLACVPALQREIAGLGISWRIDPLKPATDYVRLFSSAPASCALTGR